MKKFDVVVTRHQGLVDFLTERGLMDDSTQVLSHAGPEDVTDRDVCGVLPHALSCLTRTFTEVPLKLTPELRGKELDLATVREIAQSPVTYEVRKID